MYSFNKIFNFGTTPLTAEITFFPLKAFAFKGEREDSKCIEGTAITTISAPSTTLLTSSENSILETSKYAFLK